MKKRLKYAVFAAEPEEELGGWGDFQASFPSLLAAVSYVRMTIPQREDGWWWEIVNLDTQSVSLSSSEIVLSTSH